MGFLKTLGNFASKAVLGPAGPFIGAGFNFGLEALQARRERKFANEAWDKQNTYNSPVAQLERYKEAGMNPSYGAGMASGNAAPMSNAASNVAHANVPNMLESLSQYQSIKNAEIEGQRLEQLVQGAKIDNQIKLLNQTYLDKSMLNRIGLVGNKNLLTNMQGNKTATEYQRLMDTQELYPKQQQAKYQLDLQRLEQNKGYYNIDLQLQQLGLDRAKLGLTAGDSAFLRILSRANPDMNPKSLLKYQIGEGLLNFGGDIVKNMVPKLPFQKFKLDYGSARRGSSSSKIPYYGEY